MMQQADAAANVVKMSRRNHDEDADLDTDLAAANTALEAALAEAKIAREERDEAVAKAESKSASLEAEVADLRAHAESLRAELLDATPAKEGFKWKNLVAKLRLDKNESDKALAAKDAQIQ